MKVTKYLKILILAIALTSLSGVSFAATITVNNNTASSCNSDGAGNCTSCDTDSGTPGDQCSLPAAITSANTTAASDTIEFDNSYNIDIVGSLPAITETLEINGESNAILVSGDLATSSIGFSYTTNSKGSSLKNLTVNEFETQIKIDDIDGKVGASCNEYVTLENLKVGTDLTGNTPSNNQTVGFYAIDSKCINVTGSTFAVSGSGFTDYNVRLNTVEDVTFDNSNIGVTTNRNTAVDQAKNFNAAFVTNLTIKNSYLSINRAASDILDLQNVTGFILAKSHLGFDSSGAKLGAFTKILEMDADIAGITSLGDLETKDYSATTTCTESKSNICENYFGGSSSTDLELQGSGNYFHDNQFCSNVAQNAAISGGDGIKILRGSSYNKFDANKIDGCENNGVYIEEFDAGSGVYDLIFKDNEFGENITSKIDTAINVNGAGVADYFDDVNDTNIYANFTIEGGFIKNSQTGVLINDNNNLTNWNQRTKSLVSDIEIKNIAFGTGVTTGVSVGADKNFSATDYAISDIYLEGNTFQTVTNKVTYAGGATADNQITQPTFASVGVSGDTLTVSTTGGTVNAGEGCVFQVYFSNTNGDIQNYLQSSGATLVSFADTAGACNLNNHTFDLSPITKVATSYFGLVLSQGSSNNKQSQIPLQTTKNLTTPTPNLAVSVTEVVNNNLIPYDAVISLDGSGSTNYSTLNFDLDTNYNSDGAGGLDDDVDITLTSASPTTTFKYSDIATYLNNNLLNSISTAKTIKMTAIGELDASTQNTDLTVFRANSFVIPASASSPASVTITNSSLIPAGVDFSLDYGDGSAAVTTSQVTFSKTYTNPGEYNIVLTLTDSNDGTQVHTNTVTVAATQTPTADFTVSSNALVTTVDQNNSTGFGLSYSWDFDTATDSSGNGIADDDVDSTLATPNNTYAQDGTYTIKLTVTNPSGTVSTNKNITVHGQAPSNLDFTFTAGTLYPNDNVTFEPTATDAVSYSWDFDDITDSTDVNDPNANNGIVNDDIQSVLQKPTTTYPIDGTYNVIFRATNSAGTTTLTKPVTISPVPAPSGGGGGGSSVSYNPPSTSISQAAQDNDNQNNEDDGTQEGDALQEGDASQEGDQSSEVDQSNELDQSNEGDQSNETDQSNEGDESNEVDQSNEGDQSNLNQIADNFVFNPDFAQDLSVNQNENNEPNQVLDPEGLNESLPKDLNLSDSIDQNQDDDSQTQSEDNNIGENYMGALIDNDNQESTQTQEYVPAPQPLKSGEELTQLFGTQSKIDLSNIESDVVESTDEGQEVNKEVRKARSSKKAIAIQEAIQESDQVKQEDKQVIAKLEIDQEQRIEKSIQALDEIEQKEVSQEEKQIEISLNSDGDFCTDIYERSIGTDPFTAGDCGIKEQVYVNNPLQAGQNILLLAKEKEVVPTDNFILNGMIEGYDENPIEDVCFYVETAVDYRLAGCSQVDQNGNFIYYNDLELTNPLSFKAESQIQASDITKGNQFKIVAESRDGSYKSMPIEVEIDITKKKDIPTLVSFAGVDGSEIQMSKDLLTNLETVQVSGDEVAAVLDIGTYAKGVVNFQSLLFSTASLTSSTSGVIQVVPPENYEFKPGTKHTFSAFAESLIDPTIKSEALKINFEIVGSKLLLVSKNFIQDYYLYILGLILVAALGVTSKKALGKIQGNKKEVLDLDELQAKEISDHEIEQSGLSSLGEKVEGKLEIDDSSVKEGEELAKRNKKSLL